MNFINLNKIDYSKAFDMQKKEKQKVLNNKSSGSIYFLEHEPVITIGLNAGKESILLGESLIKANGYEICKTSRGGDVTVHEPGQLVVYFVLPLRGRSVRKFVEDITEMVRVSIEKVYDVKSEYDKNRPGLYVNGKKLCSIGFDLRGGVSMHGVAININNTLKGFDLINPCGYEGLKMTSVQKELLTLNNNKNNTHIQLDISKLINDLEYNFKNYFAKS